MTMFWYNAKLMTRKQSSFFASCCCGESVSGVTSAHRIVTHITLAERRRVAEVQGGNERKKETAKPVVVIASCFD